MKVLEEKKRLPQCNSTSSLFVSSTISVPDVDKLLVGISQMILQMVDESASVGDETVSEALAPTESSELDKIADPFNLMGDSLGAPIFKQVFSFLKQCFLIAKWSPECNVIATALVVRLVGSTSQQLTKNNWIYLMFTGLLLAQKTWDDIPLTNKEFPILWQRVMARTKFMDCGLPARKLNRMEESFLSMIHFDCFISPRTYTMFFFELRDMSEGLPAFEQPPRRPLTITDATRLLGDAAPHSPVGHSQHRHLRFSANTRPCALASPPTARRPRAVDDHAHGLTRGRGRVVMS
jgi:hypothetical protein